MIIETSKNNKTSDVIAASSAFRADDSFESEQDDLYIICLNLFLLLSITDQ